MFALFGPTLIMGGTCPYFSMVLLFSLFSEKKNSHVICMLGQEVDLSPHLILNCYVEAKYYTVTDFCRSEREFLLTCKIILTEAKG